MNEFFRDTWRGLNAHPKYLMSRYFYDETGDAIFREIMNCPEYYLTRCEMEIFVQQSALIAQSILAHFHEFDIVELGPGDASKTIHLLRALLGTGADFTYYPVDISPGVISHLETTLPAQAPGLQVHGLTGDYFHMLSGLSGAPRPRVVLFLGSNIGNIPIDQNAAFFRDLKAALSPGDLALTGFDLIKDPAIILAAYNDAAGVTRRFNLNLLSRINATFGADFDTSRFTHAPVFDPATGACKSYLVSNCDQQVHFGTAGTIHFAAGERIFMEISQKYTVPQTDAIAHAAGFMPTAHFFDSKLWFLDALWRGEG